MRFSPIALFLLLFFALDLSAQTPQPTPPADDSETIKISTNLIQLDVTVTDKDGNVVTDLRPEDFEVYENEKKQAITNFSFVTVERTAADKPLPVTNNNADKRAAVPLPPVRLKPEQVRRTYALVIDDLGLSWESLDKVKDSLRKFVREQIRDGDLVAIVRTGSGIGTLQSFTSDKNQLMAAVEKIRWNWQSRGGISAVPYIGQGGSAKEDSVLNRDAAKGREEDRIVQKQMEEMYRETFAIGTLGSLSYIIRGMQQLPGRKSLMLFSDGFRTTEVNQVLGSGVKKQNRVYDALRKIADLANRSSVVIYTMDPRGLQVPGMRQSADQNWEANADALGEDRYENFLESQQSLRFLAYETGGMPFINQNNLNKGIEDVIRDQNSYYLLGYQPDENTFDPNKDKFNKLEVKILRPGLKIRYRSGFFGISDEKVRAAAQTSQDKLIKALTSPFNANEVALSLYPVFQNDAKSGDVIQALVYINAKDLKFTRTAEGKQRANLDLLAVAYGDNGLTLDQLAKTYAIEVTDAVYQNMLANGFVYQLTVPIKKAGAYQFRVALRDSVSDKVGSASQFIEVPNVKKRMALSNLVLDNYTPEEWRKISFGATGGNESEKSAYLDSTLRQFKSGTILRYDYEVYNPKPGQQLKRQMRLIRDGKVVYEENPTAIKNGNPADPQRVQDVGALALGNNLEAGNYVLQVVVIDETNVKNYATQFVEFEIVR